MQLRCRPGDLAVIVGGSPPENIGTFVHISQRAMLGELSIELHGSDDYWEMTSKSVVTSIVTSYVGQHKELVQPGEVFCERDCFLQPIRGSLREGLALQHLVPRDTTEHAATQN